MMEIGWKSVFFMHRVWLYYDTLVRFNDRILISRRARIWYSPLCGHKGYGCKLHFSFVASLHVRYKGLEHNKVTNKHRGRSKRLPPDRSVCSASEINTYILAEQDRIATTIQIDIWKRISHFDDGVVVMGERITS